MSEEAKYREEIYPVADKVKNKTDFNKLMKSIITRQHDYGTIVVGMAAAMRGAMRLVDSSKSGGITGFQASCVMWELVPLLTMKKPPMRLISYNDMLYPQYEDKFQKTIDPSTWEHLQTEAHKILSKDQPVPIAETVQTHLQTIVDGQVPFGYTVRNS
jgi:hypothetical protein